MGREKDSKKSRIESDIAIKEKISDGLSSGVKKAQSSPYSLTDKATSDFKEIQNQVLDQEGFERNCKTLAAWCNLFTALSRQPSIGKDASCYAHGLLSHYVAGLRKKIYYITAETGEIIIVRILTYEVPEHVQKEIDKYSPR
tara:strand:- start:136 stop:561 length:426 start_codon:yes stop_codon:yes gene_type:complete